MVSNWSRCSHAHAIAAAAASAPRSSPLRATRARWSTTDMSAIVGRAALVRARSGAAPGRAASSSQSTRSAITTPYEHRGRAILSPVDVGTLTGEPLGIGGDVADPPTGHRHQRHGGHRPTALAEAHVEIQERSLAEPLEEPAVARFGGAVADDAVVERLGCEEHQREHRGADDVAVEDDRER